jgi:hypothetical protein
LPRCAQPGHAYQRFGKRDRAACVLSDRHIIGCPFDEARPRPIHSAEQWNAGKRIRSEQKKKPLQIIGGRPMGALVP